jgi:hypothetical protein
MPPFLEENTVLEVELIIKFISNVSIDEGMFGFSIGASEICLGEFTESNGPVCDDTISGLGGRGPCDCIMFLHAPTVIRIRRLLYAIILRRKYSIRSGTNN